MQHEFKVHNVPHFKKLCKNCGQGTNLDNHKCSEDRDKSKKHSCKECDKVFKKKDSLRIHLKRDHTVAEKTHLCKTCKKCFGDYELLKNHILQSHNQQNCPQCQKTMFNKMELKRHLVFEHGIKDGALICDICPKAVFFMKYHYNKHMVEKHTIKIVEKEN